MSDFQVPPSSGGSIFVELHHAGYSLALFKRYQELAHSLLDWREIAGSALSLTEIHDLTSDARRRVGILSGVASGWIYLFADSLHARDWITARFNSAATWESFMLDGVCGAITAFRHAGRLIAEEVYGLHASAQASDALDGSAGASQDKPNIIAAALARSDLFSPIESGWRVIDSFGSVYLFGEGDFVPLDGKFDPRRLETGVVYRSDWLAYAHHGGWKK